MFRKSTGALLHHWWTTNSKQKRGVQNNVERDLSIIQTFQKLILSYRSGELRILKYSTKSLKNMARVGLGLPSPLLESSCFGIQVIKFSQKQILWDSQESGSENEHCDCFLIKKEEEKIEIWIGYQSHRSGWLLPNFERFPQVRKYWIEAEDILPDKRKLNQVDEQLNSRSFKQNQ